MEIQKLFLLVWDSFAVMTMVRNPDVISVFPPLFSWCDSFCPSPLILQDIVFRCWRLFYDKMNIYITKPPNVAIIKQLTMSLTLYTGNVFYSNCVMNYKYIQPVNWNAEFFKINSQSNYVNSYQRPSNRYLIFCYTQVTFCCSI